MPKITGQVFVRDVVSQKVPSIEEDKKLMIVVGIISVPKDFILKGEHQYTVENKPALADLFQMIDPKFEFPKEINLVVYPETEKDVSEVSIGNSLSGILKSPIWKV